ncbi:MAG: 50S ribosomal protein L5 [Candidatus Diapherotrites archaeon]|uniref:Large ribosomal subunit protein uL5 n=1 Tax=Candidatus Iainarchaeum sp. TaxID=3101447 RepID=A0A497JHS0_9ARCH|nr:50S ribosomal protein L5 [Candidatus Diapherotrites archaeon]RLG70359.1 MAG: 50S ribosomal protein L5 [Candidatus Diapherotrites archaeon]
MNRMREIRVEKVVINVGVGKTGEELQKAQKIIEKITQAKAVKTKAKVRQPKWGIRPGLEIGVKVTLRGKKALDFLRKALETKEFTLKESQFDNFGNFAFGVAEHIELPGVKYEPELGIIGFDVIVALERPGYRVKRRKYKKAKVGKKHRITKEEAIEFAKEKLGIKVVK